MFDLIVTVMVQPGEMNFVGRTVYIGLDIILSHTRVKNFSLNLFTIVKTKIRDPFIHKHILPYRT